MKVSEVVCQLCGQNVIEASKRGAYLARVNPKGEPCINECRPSCDKITGNSDDALLRAIGVKKG